MIGTANPQDITIQKDERFFCTWPWETVVLMSDGTIVCGCADPFKKRPAGNAAIQSIGEIWNGPVFTALREGLQKNNPHLCTHCNLMGVVKKGAASLPEEKKLSYMPHRLFVEPCVSCNLSCYEACCNHENGIHFTRNVRLLNFDTFTKVIDELGPTLQRIDFFNYGESFIHPRAIEMIRYAKSRHPQIYLFTSTNGLLLNTSGKLHALVESGIDEITFSVDGARQESYVRYRRGGDFNKVLGIMKDLAAVKRELKRDTPYINWRYILFRWNDSDEEMNLARKLARDIGIERLCWEITDHPENSASERFVAGRPEYEQIKPEIWSALGNAINENSLRASIKPKGLPARAKTGEDFAAAAEVHNSGGALWKNTSMTNRRHITMGVQLLDDNHRILNRDFARVILPRSVPAGESVELNFQARAPQQPGHYWLKFDMVCEGIEWFESCGSPAALSRLQVH
ncbi:MAG TPA: SPASM domain-containing protein [Acidobacteriota bacterium]|nr:SPASM domain-containing protein [Acidobacteriota bacterium]